MTFLDMLIRLKQETGVAGPDPTTVIGQTKTIGRLVNWLVQSWVEIQQDHPDFDFLRKPVSFNTEANKQSYTPAEAGLTDFASWRNDSFRLYLTSAGVGTEIFLTHWPTYSDFRDYYLYSTRRTVTNRPTDITIAPDRSLVFGFTPNDIYTVSGEYFRAPQVLAADADIPIMPDRFHMAIVYKAMIKYGTFEVANEQIVAGREGYNGLLNRLLIDQLPQIQMGASLI